MPIDNHKAYLVSTELLEQTADAMLSGDFARFAARITFPYTLDTQTSQQVCQNMDDLRLVFFDVCRYLRQKNINLINRNCIAAGYQGPDTIVATYDTRLISNGVMTEDPFPCLMYLTEGTDEVWRVRQSSYPSSEGSAYRSVLTV